MSRFDITRHQDDDSRLDLPTRGAGSALAEQRLAHEQRVSQVSQRHPLGVLWRGWWIVLLCVAAGLGGGFYYLSRQTRIYSSSSRILVEPERSPIRDPDGVRASFNLATYCELIKSPLILELVDKDFPELRRMKTFAGAESPLGLLRKNLAAEVNKTDDLITVSFESPYPQEAASVVNEVVSAFKSYNAERNRTDTTRALKTLEEWKGRWEQQLDQANKKVQALKRAQPATTGPGETAAVSNLQIEKLLDAWTQARLKVLEAASNQEAAKAVAADPARLEQWTVVWQRGNADARALAADMREMERQLATIRGTMGPAHESVRLREARLEELRLKLAEQQRDAFQTYLAGADEEVNAAQRKEAEVRGLLEEQQRKAAPLNPTTADLALAEGEVRRLEKLTDALDEKIKELQLTGNIQPMAISVLERAQPPTSPVKPRPAVVLFEALMMGLVLGCGLAYLRDWTDHRLASVDEIQARLGLNVLGVLPHMDARETPAVRGQKVQLDPMSDVAEAYRTIRTAVYFGAPDGKTKKILVTSPAPGDGKTTSTSNLAIAMAQAGQRVLLMDCDFRKPMQHRLFGIEDGMGLSSVLAGHAPLSKAVKQTSTRGLYLLPSGPIPRNPSEILNSQNFAKLLAGLAEKFDHIVIDSPPVAPVTDARILGALCDITILVLRAQKSTRRVSEHACESLLSVGTQILGVIVNDVPRRRGGYGYSTYGYYQYGYGGTNGNGNGHGDGNGNGRMSHAPEGRTNGARLPSPRTAGAEDAGD